MAAAVVSRLIMWCVAVRLGLEQLLGGESMDCEPAMSTLGRLPDAFFIVLVSIRDRAIKSTHVLIIPIFFLVWMKSYSSR